MFYLDEDFRIIRSDVRNVVLERRVEKENKDGTIDINWRNEGYYSSVKNILKAYVNKTLNISKATTAIELIKDIERLETTIDKKVKETMENMKELMTKKEND